MVKLTIAPLLLIHAILSAVVLTTPVKRQSTETAVQGVQRLVADVAGLNNAASSINNGLSFAKALALNRGIQATHSDLNDGAAVMAITHDIPADEAEYIVNQIVSTQSPVESTLTIICTKAPVLQQLPVNMNQLAQDRLTGMSNSADSFFSAATIALANAPNVSQLDDVHNAFLAAFAKAIRCFSN